jgi:hypothetical protein
MRQHRSQYALESHPENACHDSIRGQRGAVAGLAKNQDSNARGIPHRKSDFNGDS